MDKEHILSEIRRTAESNGGKPLGRNRFAIATGIKYTDWYGVYWATWGEAVTEAGYAKNTLRKAIDKSILLKLFAELARELRSFPRQVDLIMRRIDPEFPDEKVFRRLGNRGNRAALLMHWCNGREGFEDVIEIVQPVLDESRSTDVEEDLPKNIEDKSFGFVYLFKSGKHYKIGRSNSSGRREYELAIQLPDKLAKVHEISTDDPVGIEKYWHSRFAEKRKNGEWFELTTADVKDYKRRKFM